MIKLRSFLGENYQMAVRLYADKLTPEDIAFLTKLCGRDYLFKTMAELLIEDKADFSHWKTSEWEDAVTMLRHYNDRIFPIQNFSFDSKQPILTKRMVKHRIESMKILAGWPSIAKRNLRNDIAEPRRDFARLEDRLHYIDSHLQYLNNKSDEQKAMLLKKIFSSDHQTFEDVLDFVEDKHNLMSGGAAYDKTGLYELVKKNEYDLKIVYDKDNVVVVDVTGQPGIKAIGCNSLWCFTYGNEYGKAGEQFDQYSHNGHVYAIIDFKQEQNDASFIHILIAPLDDQKNHDSTGLYNMANEEEYGNAKDIILWITGKDESILNVFTWEDI